jgi:hypothetical protein
MPFSQSPEKHPNVSLTIAGAVAVWFALVFVLGASGSFVRPPGTPPLPVGIAVSFPIIGFLAAFRMSQSFRDSVMTADLRLMTGIQAWRFGGLAFLALYAQGLLPGLFAWPAALGDIAIGVTSPWIVRALIQSENFKDSRLFLVWNLLGILDLVVAVTTGVLGSWLAAGGEVTTAPMAQLPLVLIPAFFVPIFVMLHLAAIFQSLLRNEPHTRSIRTVPVPEGRI